MITETLPAPLDAGPQLRPARVLRALLVVVTAVALLVALATAVVWAWGPGRSTDVWASRFGDPRIRLADGAVLPASPETIRRWSLEPTTYGLPDDTSALEAAFGGPVVAVDDHTWATATGTVEFPQLGSVLADPASETNAGPTFLGAGVAQRPDAPSFATEEEREHEVRRILVALGWPADATLRRAGGAVGRHFQALPNVPEAATYPHSTTFPGPRFEFADDGTLGSLTLWPWALAQPATDAQVRSAEQALDDLRHHRADAYVYPNDVPNLVERVLEATSLTPGGDYPTPTAAITTATLYGDSSGVLGQTHPVWVFTDADGTDVGMVLAAEGDIYPAGVR